MNTKLNHILCAVVLIWTSFLSSVVFAGTDGAGLVLYTALQRSKVSQPSKLKFACGSTRGKHDIYVFDFYKHSPHNPFGTVKMDEKGYVCDAINLSVFVARHSAACVDLQLQWAQEQIHSALQSFAPDSPYRVTMTVQSQIGDTHWSDNWGAYIAGLFSFISESRAHDLECDLKFKLTLNERLEDGKSVVLDEISYSFTHPESFAQD